MRLRHKAEVNNALSLSDIFSDSIIDSAPL